MTEKYTVKFGDTLTSIARRHGMSWRDLYESLPNAAFRVLRPSPHLIMPNDAICVPSKNAAAKRLGAFTPVSRR